MATKPAELYDEDFYAWTQAQAKALRPISGATTASTSSIWRRRSKIWAVPNSRRSKASWQQSWRIC